MKLRRKLAAVLAATMIVSAVPVVTMAATSNSVNCNITVRDGSKLGYNSSKLTVLGASSERTTVSAIAVNDLNNPSYETRIIPNLELYPKNTENAGTSGQTFFVELEDGDFNFEAFAAAYLNASAVNSTTRKFTSMDALASDTIRIYTAGGTAYAYNKSNVRNSEISSAHVTSLGASAESFVKNSKKLRYEVSASTYADFTLLSDDTMRVDVYGTWRGTNTATADAILVPLFVKAGSTQVKVKIDAANTFITSETKTIGTANEDGKELTITVDDAKTSISVDGGEISKLIVTEEVIGALKNADTRKIKLELPSSSDLEWKLSDVKANGKRGFSGTALKADGTSVSTVDYVVPVSYGTTGRNGSTDKQVLIVELPQWSDNNSRGVIELTGLTVRPTDDEAKTGELSVKVSAVNDDDLLKSKSITVGVVADYSVSLTCEKPASVKAGRSALVNDYSVEVVLAESVKDAFTTGRDISFTLENGYIVGAADILNYVDDNKVAESSPKSNTYKQAALATIQHLVDEEDIKFEEDGKHAKITDVEVNTNGQVIGFTLDGDSLCHTSYDKDERLDDEQRDDIKITMPVAACLEATGEVKLEVSGRALAQVGKEEKVTCKIADVTSPIKVDVTAAELKVGLQDQTSGSIVISETEKGMIERGTIVLDANPDEVRGIKFQSVPKVEATGIKVGDVELSSDKKYVYIEVEKTSTEAGKITISDVSFTTDRTVPQGTFDVRIYGTSLSDEQLKTYEEVVNDKYVVKDFIKITTPNTEDVKNNGLAAVTSTFTLGSTKYTVDGKEFEMDAEAYAEDGRTMVPVRYIAEAFGIEKSNVLYANQVATIIAGDKIVQVTMGSNILTVNGAKIQMDAAATVKNGRAYVPMKFIAAALGVNVAYDADTKVVTFSNK